RFTDITKGDVDWPSIQSALVEIGYSGWLAAEVRGGDLQRLSEVAAQMDAALNCNATLDSLVTKAKA
ncbi:MAG: sugar phosphate isomerase/epimerase, partial [Planctomycetota bacterium]